MDCRSEVVVQHFPTPDFTHIILHNPSNELSLLAYMECKTWGMRILQAKFLAGFMVLIGWTLSPSMYPIFQVLHGSSLENLLCPVFCTYELESLASLWETNFLIVENSFLDCYSSRYVLESTFTICWRTRTIFDMAVRVHINIQERDIEVGRNLGNWILRWLDRMKPSAQIRGLTGHPPSVGNIYKHVTYSSTQQPPGSIQRFGRRIMNRGTVGSLSTSSMYVWPKSFPTLAAMLLPSRSTGANIQYRNFCFSGPYLSVPNYRKGRFDGVIRKDIIQWMQQN